MLIALLLFHWAPNGIAPEPISNAHILQIELFVTVVAGVTVEFSVLSLTNVPQSCYLKKPNQPNAAQLPI